MVLMGSGNHSIETMTEFTRLVESTQLAGEQRSVRHALEARG